MRKVFITVCVGVFILALVNCEQDVFVRPTLLSISPSSKVSHMPSFILTITYQSVHGLPQVVFGGTVKQATWVSYTELTCQIDPDDIVMSSSTIDYVNVPVIIRNLAVHSGQFVWLESNSLDFTIKKNHTFNDPINIFNTTGLSMYPVIAVDSTGNFNLVWGDDTLGNSEIYFSRSINNGVSWSSPVNISNSPYINESFPSIAVNNTGNIYVVCEGNNEIYFIRSGDNGGSWDPPVNISYNSGLSWCPAIAVDSTGYINVVWMDDTPGNSRIYFSCSWNNGDSWWPPESIYNNSLSGGYPAIAVDSTGNINVVWRDIIAGSEQIYFSRSINYGMSWSPPANISNTPGSCDTPAIAVDSTGNINVVWKEDITSGNSWIYFSRLPYNGVDWSRPVDIFFSTLWSCRYPKIAVDSAGNINVVWMFYSSTQNEIDFSRSTNNGQSWSQAVNISSNVENCCCSFITVDSAGNIIVVWNDTSEGDIYFTCSTH